MDRETEEYLAKIRKTIAESKNMVETVKLRFAETDRMLAESGTSREEVMKMRFTSQQREAVNAELERRGFEAIEEAEESPQVPERVHTLADFSDAGADCQNRQRKFATMMKQYRI